MIDNAQGRLYLKRTGRFSVLGLEPPLALDGNCDDTCKACGGDCAGAPGRVSDGRSAEAWCQRVSWRLGAPYHGSKVSLDTLAGPWKVFQLARGHRFSNDDLFTAWRAGVHHPRAQKLLDLGCGIGSVGLSTLALMEDPAATLVGIEAQQVSHELATHSVLLNGLGHRVSMLRGDLRTSAATLNAHAGRGGGGVPDDLLFDLVTGSPPYLPAADSVLSPEPQRAHCRVELRGSVYDYCAAAARHLKPTTGRFVFVMLAQVTGTLGSKYSYRAVFVLRLQWQHFASLALTCFDLHHAKSKYLRHTSSSTF